MTTNKTGSEEYDETMQKITALSLQYAIFHPDIYLCIVPVHTEYRDELHRLWSYEAGVAICRAEELYGYSGG